MIGQTLANRYHIIALLGSGAMGTVYRATDLQTYEEGATFSSGQKMIGGARG